MSDQALRELAGEAGIAPDWLDMAGQLRTVSAETLHAVLATQGIQAKTARQIGAALSELKRGHAAQALPPLVTAISRRAVTLPARRNGPSQAFLTLEGEVQERALDLAYADGRVTLRAPKTVGYHRLRLGRQETILAVAPMRGTSCLDRTGGTSAWGLAAQFYSLSRPGDDGAGDFSALSDFVRSCAKAGGSAVAISPLHAQFSADSRRFSPYSPSNRLWLNVLHIDVAAAAQMLDLPVPGSGISGRQPKQGDFIDWPRLSARKLPALRLLFDSATEAGIVAGEGAQGASFAAFQKEGGDALSHHALFETLHAHFLAKADRLWHWRTWPAAYRDPQSDTCRRFMQDHRVEISFHVFLQWLAECQLRQVREACDSAGMTIGLIGDIAVGADTGGSQAWAHQDEMLTELSIGAPPDAFNLLGQSWGVTTFSPLGLKRHGFRSFIELLRRSMRHAGGIRMDHILGLSRLWVVPAGASSKDGAYLQYPLTDLLRLVALESHRSRAFVLGEDLGTVPPGFREILAEHGIMGMQVLWFQREGDHFLAPNNWSPGAAGMTTTHDLPTVAGWWSGGDLRWREKVAATKDRRVARQNRQERARDRTALWQAFTASRVATAQQPATSDTEAVVDGAVRYLAKTPCDLVLLPLEDALGLREQPNLPGTIDEHPNWRRRIRVDTATICQEPLVKRRLGILARQRKKT
ncbi:MAG: 4-alpha-glucanotransferase [Dongiaceae bacterium]